MIVKGGQALLRDFDSTNGTFVNDEQIKGEVPLKDGDVLRLGPLSFKVVIEGMPAPSKPTPPPKPKGADFSDEDAAAALLSVEEEGGGGVSMSTSDTSEDEVPGGTTVMDMPAFVPQDVGETAEKKEEKPEEKKTGGKATVKTGAAQDAAKAILDKMRAGRRK